MLLFSYNLLQIPTFTDFFLKIGYYKQICHWDHILLQPNLQGKHVPVHRGPWRNFVYIMYTCRFEPHFRVTQLSCQSCQSNKTKDWGSTEQGQRGRFYGKLICEWEIKAFYFRGYLLMCSHNPVYFTWYWHCWDTRMGTRTWGSKLWS